MGSMTRTRPRRTQAQRRSETRVALLDATLDALVQLGYKATTTTEIAHRAGVSMGALLHHYPTKADLLTAAIGHAWERRMVEFRQVMAQVDAAADKVDAAIDLLWSMFTGPTYLAFAELWVAARTDAELAGPLVVIDREFVRSSEAAYAELFPDMKDLGDVARDGQHMVFALLNGLAMSQMIDGYSPYRAESVIATYKAMVHAALDIPRAADSG
jgi:AcrR family transcriptional regulator